MPAARAPAPGGAGGLARPGARGPARAPGAVAWLGGGQTAVLGPRGALGLPQPRSLTPDAPGGATWPGGSGTTPGGSERGAPGSGPVGRSQPTLPHPTVSFRAPSFAGFCLLSSLTPTCCSANIVLPASSEGSPQGPHQISPKSPEAKLSSPLCPAPQAPRPLLAPGAGSEPLGSALDALHELCLGCALPLRPPASHRLETPPV